MDVSVRAIATEDWQIFRQIRLRALADAPDAFGRTVEEAEQQSEAEWRERAGGSNPTVLVFEDGNAVAMGGLFVRADEERAWVWGMWTAPEARHRGYAGLVLGFLIDWASAEGHDVSLHVTEGNDGARELYLRHGFVSTGEWEPLREGSDLQIERLERKR